MIKFSKEKVLLLHKLIAEETGGSIGVRDEALLESALENVFSGFGGQEFYPTKEEKGARLGYALISNHAFVDGNKRIGMYVMLTFLEVNGIRLDCTNDEVVEGGLAVASGAMDYEALATLEKTPLEQLIDHSFGSIFPNMDAKWLRVYERTALYGETLEITDYSPEIDTELKIICFPTFPGHCGCMLFDRRTIQTVQGSTSENGLTTPAAALTQA